MAVTVLTPSNTFRLTTLDAVLAEVPMADQLLFTESLIDQASASIAQYCGTILAQQKYREIQGGWYPTTMFFLRYWPLVSVTSVMHGTTAETDYRIESAASGMLYRRTGWGLRWCSDEDWTVEYIAGYRLPEQLNPPAPTGPELPNDLERACIECIKIWFHERLVGSRVESKTFGLTGDRIDYGVQASKRGIPALAKDLLAPWRRVAVA
jgi:hypothetical protein